MNSAKPIIFFDGVCGLCNRFIDLLMHLDGQESFLFAPLQGESAKELLPDEMRVMLSSIVLRHSDGSIVTESTAVLAIVGVLPLPWRLFSWFRLVPTFIRDAVYRFVARNRHRIWPPRLECRMPTESERSRFLP